MKDKVFNVRPDIDRGWAWIVMITTYLGMLFYCTVLYMAGILYVALLEKFQEGEAKTSLVGAVSTGLLCFAAPLGGVINNRFSCRTSIMLGGAFTTVGLAASAFVPDLNWMILTGGVIVGLGFSISSSGLICVVGFYFEKWRDAILSLSFLGAGVAMFISAPFGIFLINRHGLTATFLILACIEAHICVFGMLSRPSSMEQKVHSQKRKEREISINSKSKSYLDLTLLQNKSYACFLCSTSTWNFALTVAIMHLPNYLSVIGGSSRDIGLLMTSFSVANMIGRLLGSLTVSKLHERCIYVHVVVLAVSGLLTSLFVIYSSLTGGAYIFAVQLGVLTGWPNVMMTSISINFVGVAKLSEAYGLAYVFCGIGASTGPVVIGYVYGRYKSYENSFIVAGCVLILGFLFGVASLWLRNNSLRTNDSKVNELIVAHNHNVSKQSPDMKYTNNRKCDRDIIIETCSTEINYVTDDGYRPVSTSECGSEVTGDMCNGMHASIEMEKVVIEHKGNTCNDIRTAEEMGKLLKERGDNTCNGMRLNAEMDKLLGEYEHNL